MAKKPSNKKIIGENVAAAVPQSSKTPFARKGDGVISRGVVHEVRAHSDGKSMHVTIRHGRAKPDGMFSSYEDETRVRVPKSGAKQFHLGKRVKVHVHPY
ncbi:MAG TPA: hypothetical protein VJO33_17110 [Gemmatimonadaceae bacterium]|nr:hypothetical protein [Gemmatimonadaceae bacterium]